MLNKTADSLILTIDDKLMPAMVRILQSGFIIMGYTGYSIKEFLLKELGLSPEFISERIGTIFLDGQPVDDIDLTIIKKKSTVALSGAMPGLVGAMMRRNSPYASFRSSITHKKSKTDPPKTEGIIRLKLFNVLLKEMGAGLLKKGVFINSSLIEDLLKAQGVDFRQGNTKILLNEKPVNYSFLEESGFRFAGDIIFFSVRTIGE